MSEKKQKKSSFTETEWCEIQNVMEEIGIKNLSEYILYITRNLNSTDLEFRKTQIILNQHRELLTVYNKIRGGIDVEQNMNAFMEGGSRLCQELM